MPDDTLGRFVYVTSFFGETVSAYRIAQNGALKPVVGSPFSTGSGAPVSVAVDVLGRFVYVANEGADSVSAYRIGGSGILTPVAGSPFPAGHVPASIAVDLSGRF